MCIPTWIIFFACTVASINELGQKRKMRAECTITRVTAAAHAARTMNAISHACRRTQSIWGKKFIDDSVARTTTLFIRLSSLSIHSKYLYNHLSQVQNARAIWEKEMFCWTSIVCVNSFFFLHRYLLHRQYNFNSLALQHELSEYLLMHYSFRLHPSKIYAEICIDCRCAEKTLRTHAICLKLNFFPTFFFNISHTKFIVYHNFSSMDLNPIYSVLITYNWIGISRMAKKKIYSRNTCSDSESRKQIASLG